MATSRSPQPDSDERRRHAELLRRARAGTLALEIAASRHRDRLTLLPRVWALRPEDLPGRGVT